MKPEDWVAFEAAMKDCPFGVINGKLAAKWGFAQACAYRDAQPAVAQEPVHFRAVLCSEQQNQAIGVTPKVVGFVDKKAAEQFILEKRDFQGWGYSLEPLYGEAQAVAVNEQMYEALQVADRFCGSLTSDECSDSVHIPIRDAIAAYKKIKRGV